MNKKLAVILTMMILTSIIGGCSSKKADHDIGASNDEVGIETNTDEE